MAANGYKVSFRGDKNVLKLDSRCRQTTEWSLSRKRLNFMIYELNFIKLLFLKRSNFLYLLHLSERKTL